MVGGWTLIADAAEACGNAELGDGSCLSYAALTLDGKTVTVRMIGVDRSEGDRIVLSIPVEPTE